MSADETLHQCICRLLVISLAMWVGVAACIAVGLLLDRVAITAIFATFIFASGTLRCWTVGLEAWQAAWADLTHDSAQ